MAKLQFNRQGVIDISIKLFAQQGYTGSSMQQIVKVTGLKPGSIYNAFGNKEGLYKEALESYSDRSIKHIRETIEAAQSTQLGICQVLEKAIQGTLEKNYCSCFIIKTQLELAARGAVEGGLFEFSLQRLAQTETLYKNYLLNDFNDEQSAAKATSIMLHVFGLRVYGYQRKSVQVLRKGLMQGLPWLPWSDFYQ